MEQEQRLALASGKRFRSFLGHMEILLWSRYRWLGDPWSWDWAMGLSSQVYSDLAYPIMPKDRSGGNPELKNDPKNGKDSGIR